MSVLFRIFLIISDVTADLIIFISRAIAVKTIHVWDCSNKPWFDHRFNWMLGPSDLGSERGIHVIRYIRPTDRVLDVCCGDGMYSGLFYSRFAKSVDAIDRDEGAIRFARKRYARANVQFFQIADVVNDRFPSPTYDVVVMFAALEHFSTEEGTKILSKIASSLSGSSDGFFLGSTPIFEEATGHGHPEHDNEFVSMDQLQNFLRPHFRSVELWTSKWGLDDKRNEAYFLCKNPIAS